MRDDPHRYSLGEPPKIRVQKPFQRVEVQRTPEEWEEIINAARKNRRGLFDDKEE
jgi:hypothetical protein